MVNFICVTYFIELAKSVSKLGLGIGLLCFAVSQIICYVTLTSIVAICTNGEMEDGGLYYILSRTLGADIAGLVGIILIIAHITIISSRTFYFSKVIQDFIFPNVFTKNTFLDSIVIKTSFTFVTFFLCLAPLKYRLYMLFGLTLIVAVAIVLVYAGFFKSPTTDTPWFTGLKSENIESFFSLLSHNNMEIIKNFGRGFASTNGIIAVTDFSANLEPQQSAIKTGSFAAMFASTLLFLFLIFLVAAGFDRSKLPRNYLEIIKISVSPIVSLLGFTCSAVGSAVTMCTGGARIIKLMVYDRLLPSFMNLFEFRGEPAFDQAIILGTSFLLSLINNNSVIDAITMISFHIPLALANFALFIADSAHYPGFRPTSRFYNRYLSLLFGILCVIRTFFIDWFIAIVFAVFCAIVFWVYKRLVHVRDNWGSVIQSRIFYSTMKEELALYDIKPHPKTFRPNLILATTKHPDDNRPAIDFINQVLHRHGMAEVGRIIISCEKVNFKMLQKERESTFLTDNEGYRTFYDVTVAPTFADGVRDLLLMAGIGVMRPNTLCLEFPDDWADQDYTEFVGAINVAFDANYAVTVVRHAGILADRERETTIDVWWLSDDGGMTLLLPYLLSKQALWKHTKLRVMTIAFIDEGDEYKSCQMRMMHLLYKFRIKAEVFTIEVSLKSDSPSQFVRMAWRGMMAGSSAGDGIDQLTHRYMILADLIRQYSAGAAFVALSMVVPHETTDPRVYMSWLDMMSAIHVPFCFIRGNGESALSWTV